MGGRTFTREFKLEVCRQLASGQKRVSQVLREYQLGESVVSRWRKAYEARGEEAFTAPPGTSEETAEQRLERRIAELERVCGQLAVENALLKKGLKSGPSRSGMP